MFTLQRCVVHHIYSNALEYSVSTFCELRFEKTPAPKPDSSTATSNDFVYLQDNFQISPVNKLKSVAKLAKTCEH